MSRTTQAVICGGPYAGTVVPAELPHGAMVRVPYLTPLEYGIAECQVVWREDVMELHWPADP
jgi:hypothetical protein